MKKAYWALAVLAIPLVFVLLKKLIKPDFDKWMKSVVKKSKYTDKTREDLELDSSVEKVKNAMKGWGTREKVIYEELGKFLSVTDFVRFVNTFGSLDGLDFPRAINDELTVNEMGIANSILNRSIGIKIPVERKFIFI